MIKYCDLERYILENSINKERDLFSIIGEFVENYKKPNTKQKKVPIPIIYNKDTEFTFEQVVELLGS